MVSLKWTEGRIGKVYGDSVHKSVSGEDNGAKPATLRRENIDLRLTPF